MDRGKNGMLTHLVIVSLESWDEIWRRNQYLVDGLLRAHPSLEVLFVEPPADPVHAALHRRRPTLGKGLRVASGYGGRLHLLQPTKLLPRALGPAADALLRERILRAIRSLGWKDGILWINDPGAAQLTLRLRWPSVYDITDDWVEAARGQREHDRIQRADALLLGTCDEVVVCSPGLVRSKRTLRTAGASVLRLVPNAVDRERYRVPLPRPGDAPPTPFALYVGTLHEDRLDVGLVTATARAVAKVAGEVVLLGPNALSDENRRRLEAEPALRVLGARPWDEVPAYLQHADVLIVPHVVDDFTESLDPIKLYEYLAVGRPIVSTPVAGFRDDPRVNVASASDFPATVVEQVTARETTVEHDGVPDWGDRVVALTEVLEALTARSAQRPLRY